MGKFGELIRLPEFDGDLKRLLKRFRTLEDDLTVFIDAQLFLYHKLNLDNGGIFHLPNLPVMEPPVFKAKKFACRALKGMGSRTGIRVIYSFEANPERIILIEIYSKGDKTTEDKERVAAFLKAFHAGGG